MNWQMAHKWISPEIPRISSFERNHTELVCRVSSISKELDSNAWVCRIAYAICNNICLGKSDEYMLGTFEDSCVWIAWLSNVFCFCNKTLLMDKFVSITRHFICTILERCAWVLAEKTVHLFNLLANHSGYLCDPGPKLIHLLFCCLRLILTSIESLITPINRSSWHTWVVFKWPFTIVSSIAAIVVIWIRWTRVWRSDIVIWIRWNRVWRSVIVIWSWWNRVVIFFTRIRIRRTRTRSRSSLFGFNSRAYLTQSYLISFWFISLHSQLCLDAFDISRWKVN